MTMPRERCMVDPLCTGDVGHDGACIPINGSLFATSFAVAAADPANIELAVRAVHAHLIANTPDRIGPFMANVAPADDVESLRVMFDAVHLDDIDRVMLTAAAMAFTPSVIVMGFVPRAQPGLN